MRLLLFSQRILRIVFGPVFCLGVVLALLVSLSVLIIGLLWPQIIHISKSSLILITCVYVFVTYFIAQASITTQRINTLNWINSYLEIEGQGKTLLMDPKETIDAVRGDPDKINELYKVIVKLNRAAAAAIHAIALEELFELHWDWYYLLYEKFEPLMDEIRASKARAFIGDTLFLQDMDIRASTMKIWIYYIVAIRKDIYRYKDKIFPHP